MKELELAGIRIVKKDNGFNIQRKVESDSLSVDRWSYLEHWNDTHNNWEGYGTIYYGHQEAHSRALRLLSEKYCYAVVDENDVVVDKCPSLSGATDRLWDLISTSKWYRNCFLEIKVIERTPSKFTWLE